MHVEPDNKSDDTERKDKPTAIEYGATAGTANAEPVCTVQEYVRF